jgi:hypothetical protein
MEAAGLEQRRSLAQNRLCRPAGKPDIASTSLLEPCCPLHSYHIVTLILSTHVEYVT